MLVGEWSDGMAIYDAIVMSKCYVTIIAYGQAESMSSIILQAADRRLMTPNTYFMSHYGSTAAGGEYQSVQNWVKYEKRICDIMLDIYSGSCIGGKFFKEKYGHKPDQEKVKTFLTKKTQIWRLVSGRRRRSLLWFRRRDYRFMGKAKIKTIDEAWLGLDSIESDLFNPMSVLRATDDDFNLHLSWLLTRPEYLSFITHHILNIQLLPSQALFLKEVWNRKFPMLIASRGFGKSFMLSLYAVLRALILPRRKVVVVGAAFRQSKGAF